MKPTPNLDPEEQQLLDDFEAGSLRSVGSLELRDQLRAVARSTDPMNSKNASIPSPTHDPGERAEPDEAMTGRSWESFFLDSPPVSGTFLEDRGCQEQADREPL